MKFNYMWACPVINHPGASLRSLLKRCGNLIFNKATFDRSELGLFIGLTDSAIVAHTILLVIVRHETVLLIYITPSHSN